MLYWTVEMAEGNSIDVKIELSYFFQFCYCFSMTVNDVDVFFCSKK